MSGYSDAGASLTKKALRAFNAVSGSPIFDIDFNNATMRQRGRMLYMASPIAAAAVNTNRTKIVGSGLKMKCSINRKLLGMSERTAQEWCEKTEAEFKLWSENRHACDMLGENNFFEIQQLAVKSWLMSGDVFVLIKRDKPTPLNPYSLRLQLVEADRVGTPYTGNSFSFGVTEGKCGDNDVHDGVEVDKNGRIVAYHICSGYPGFPSSTKSQEWIRVEAVGKKTGLPNILHIMDAERPDQYRGVTYLAPVIELLLQGRRYTEAELTAAIIQSYLTAWVETETDATDNPLFPEEEGDEEYDENPEMGPGNVIHLKKGEKVQFGNPNIPTAGFEVFMKSIIKQAGAALEMPYDVLIKEFNSSYSAAKGALEEGWEAFKMRRSWFVNDLTQPVYEIFLSEAVALGRVYAPGFFDDPLIRAAWCGARWDGPAQTHLDPVKEANANEIQVKNGWKTNEQVTREFYGGNWSDNVQDLQQEAQMIQKYLSENQKNAQNKNQTNKEDENDEE